MASFSILFLLSCTLLALKKITEINKIYYISERNLCFAFHFSWKPLLSTVFAFLGDKENSAKGCENINEGYSGLPPQITANYFIFLMIAIQSQEKSPVNIQVIYKMFSNCVASH